MDSKARPGLIPRFSIRFLFGALAVAGVLSAVLANMLTVQPVEALVRELRGSGSRVHVNASGQVYEVSLIGRQADNDLIEKLGLLKHLREVSMHDTSVDDRGLRMLCEKCDGIWKLNLHSNIDISNDGLKDVGKLSRLRHLYLIENPGITDAGLAHLCSVAGLKQLHTSDDLDYKPLRRLRKHLPDLMVDWLIQEKAIGGLRKAGLVITRNNLNDKWNSENWLQIHADTNLELRAATPHLAAYPGELYVWLRDPVDPELKEEIAKLRSVKRLGRLGSPEWAAQKAKLKREIAARAQQTTIAER